MKAMGGKRPRKMAGLSINEGKELAPIYRAAVKEGKGQTPSGTKREMSGAHVPKEGTAQRPDQGSVARRKQRRDPRA